MRMRNMWSRMLLGALTSCSALAGAVLAQEAEPAPMPMPAAAAVEYEVMPLPPSIWDGKPTEATIKLERQVQQMLKGDLALADNAANFDAYFTRYNFPLLTQHSNEQLARLHVERSKFFRDYLRRNGTTSAEAHDRLVNLTFLTMKDVVKKKYHPAVRYNAMLMIAELNTKEAVTGSGSQAGPADPLAAARDFMIAELLDPKQIDAVKVAALIGILRHLELNADRPADRQFPAGVRNAIVKQLLPMASDKKVPAERDPAGHAWLRARLVESLTALCRAGYDPNIGQLLVQIVGDDTEPMMLRFTAAESLGSINLASDPKLTGSEVARKLAELLLQATRAQLAKMDDELAIIKEMNKRNGYGPGTPSSVSGPYQNPNDPAVLKQEQRMLLVRRILKDHAVRTLHGLKGTDGTLGAMSAAKGNQKEYVTNVIDAVTALGKVADVAAGAPAPKLAEFAKSLRSHLNSLDTVVKTGGAPKPIVPPPTEGTETPEVPGGPGAEAPEGPAAAPAPAAKAPAPAGKAPAAPPAGELDVPDAPAADAKKN